MQLHYPHQTDLVIDFGHGSIKLMIRSLATSEALNSAGSDGLAVHRAETSPNRLGTDQQSFGDKAIFDLWAECSIR